MKKTSFEYGPIARGCYFALIVSSIFVFLLKPLWFLYYMLFIFFLGFGLKAFLIHTGIHRQWQSMMAKLTHHQYQQMQQGFHRRKQQKLSKQAEHIAKMRDKMNPKL